MADETAEPKAAAAEKEQPAWKGSMSSKKPLVAPDGHVSLSQEDIDARDQ